MNSRLPASQQHEAALLCQRALTIAPANYFALRRYLFAAWLGAEAELLTHDDFGALESACRDIERHWARMGKPRPALLVVHSKDEPER